MAKKKENEAVVNRFLFSTLYAVVMAFYIYYTYAAGVSAKYFLMYMNVFNVSLVVLGLAAIGVGIAHFGMKKSSKYQFAVLVAAFLIVAFLRFSMLIPIVIPSLSFFGSVKDRHIIAAFITLLVYVYEVIVYFVKNR